MPNLTSILYVVVPSLLALGVHILTRDCFTLTLFDTATTPTPPKKEDLLREKVTDYYVRRDVYIPALEKESIHGWFYLPNKHYQHMLPIIVMSHGIGSQKDMGLEPYAEKFCLAGFAVFAMDYRNFGGSISSSVYHRNYINPWDHVESIKRVVRAIRAGILESERVDPFRIALWGTSFGCGHVLVAAAEMTHGEDKGLISGVISQVPHLDGQAASLRKIKQMGILGTLRTAFISISDIFRNVLGLSPIYVKIAGTKEDGVTYMLMSKEELQKYFAKHPQAYLGGWENRAPARTLLYISRYSPIKSVQNVKAPILFIGATEDTLCPIEYVQKAWNMTLPQQGENPSSCAQFYSF
jgi:cephalosporin-C deacetylase-like acetyl esterase